MTATAVPNLPATVNLVLVVGSNQMYDELEQRLAGVFTSFGEPIECVNLEKPDGIPEVVDSFTRQNREAAIKEYFFGDSKRTLSPSLQVISFDDVAIFKAPDGMYADGWSEPSGMHWWNPG